MNISTKIAKEELRSRISQIALDFALRLSKNPPQDINSNYTDFQNKLKVLLKI